MSRYDTIKIEIDNSGWTDISNYVALDYGISWYRGINGNGVINRIARPGNISFTLHDSTGQFDPFNSSTVLSSGTNVRFYIEHDGIGRVLWYGKIRNVTPPRKDNLFQVFSQVNGVCEVDEFNRPLETPTITTNKTASQVVDEIISDLGMTVTASQKEYGTMAKTFVSVFDTAKSKQNAVGEITKAVMSELGFFYVKGTRSTTDNFIITVDGRNTREGRSFIYIPKEVVDSGFLLKEDGDFLLKEDGWKIVLDEKEEFSAFGKLKNKTLSYGKNIINDIFVTVYPRDYASATQVIFSLTNTPKIAAGETLEILVRYRDPDQEAQSISARSTITPVATTDYTANSQDDGGGSDLTANLDVTAVYNAAEIKYTLENTGGTDLYVTKLQARGEGIYFYGNIKLQAQDATSQANNGYKSLSLNLKYLDDANEGQAIANAIIAKTKDVFQDVEWIEVEPNAGNLFPCMFLDIGDPINIPIMNASGTIENRKFYINGISWSGKPGAWLVRYDVISQEVTEI